LYEQSLAIKENTLGPNHPDVAQSLNNLAALYSNQGRYADAEPLYQRSLAMREKAFGPDHLHVAESLNNIAALDYKQGRYADAEPYDQRALAIRERTLGPNHPDVTQSLNNLAELYRAQDRYADALPIVRRIISQNGADKAVPFAALYGAQAKALISPTQALDASFAVVQRSVSTAAGEAVSKLAARFGAGTNELAQLVRIDQDLTAESDRLDKTIISAVSRPPAERNASAEDQLRRRIDEIKSERDKLPHWAQSRLLERPFNPSLAYQLYRQVLGPIEEIISQKTRLSFVVDGALTSLPPQVLITSEPGDKDFASLDWLVRKYAITIFPSVASLKTLSAEKSTVSAIKPMIGFGNPIFDRTTPTGGVQQAMASNRSPATSCSRALAGPLSALP
jgi:tetratricopeptide (TPR) repeat protein